MSLTKEEKFLVASNLTEFTTKILSEAFEQNEQGMHEEMERFHSFLCRALEAAKIDARHDALITSTN